MPAKNQTETCFVHAGTHKTGTSSFQVMTRRPPCGTARSYTPSLRLVVSADAVHRVACRGLLDGSFAMHGTWRYCFDYKILMQSFAKVFGAAHVHVIPYTEDVIDRLIARMGLDACVCHQKHSRLNQSLSDEQVCALRQLNQFLHESQIADSVASKSREHIFSLSQPQNTDRRWGTCGGGIFLWVLHTLRWTRSWRWLRTHCGINTPYAIKQFHCRNSPLCLFLRNRKRLQIQRMVLSAMEILNTPPKGLA